MISHEHKFIFVHIPKTAGESVTGALGKYADATIKRTRRGHRWSLDVGHPELNLGKHATLSEYRTALGDDFEKYRILTTVRNPWDRAISYYFYGQKHHFEEAYFDRDILATHVRDVEPQVDYLTLDGEVRVDILMRFETISDDFRDACERLGLPKLKLPKQNQGIDRKDYHEYIDETMQRMIGSRYREDVATFGYQFE